MGRWERLERYARWKRNLFPIHSVPPDIFALICDFLTSNLLPHRRVHGSRPVDTGPSRRLRHPPRGADAVGGHDGVRARRTGDTDAVASCTSHHARLPLGGPRVRRLVPLCDAHVSLCPCHLQTFPPGRMQPFPRSPRGAVPRPTHDEASPVCLPSVPLPRRTPRQRQLASDPVREALRDGLHLPYRGVPVTLVGDQRRAQRREFRRPHGVRGARPFGL